MPDIDGFGVQRALRAQPALAHTLFVAMTGYGQRSDRERSIAAGFDAHLVKPVELALLEDLLMQAAQRRSDQA
jgi:CheY-like chemotaxis protein